MRGTAWRKWKQSVSSVKEPLWKSYLTAKKKKKRCHEGYLSLALEMKHLEQKIQPWIRTFLKSLSCSSVEAAQWAKP